MTRERHHLPVPAGVRDEMSRLIDSLPSDRDMRFKVRQGIRNAYADGYEDGYLAGYRETTDDHYAEKQDAAQASDNTEEDDRG